MTALERTLEYLDRRLVRYAHTQHPVAYTAREVAAVEHMPAHRLAKTVVFLGEEGYGLALVPADTFVDLQDLRTILGSPAVRLATEEEIAALFPTCELGAMPALGNLFGLPVYVDHGLAEEEFMAFNAGTHRDLVHMSTADFLRLVEPVIGRFARAMEAPAGF
jgi:Ala-tRNA(Pro) deacylase